MSKFLEQIMVLFLLTTIVLLTMVIVIFLDYNGFIDLRSSLPDGLKKNRFVSDYVKNAEINSMAPRDQEAVLLEEKKKYIEKLLKKMKVESMKILEEKQRLEYLFKQMEEEKNTFQDERDRFEKKMADYNEKQRKAMDEDYIARLDNLSVTYSKMEPKAVADILMQSSPEESFAVLKRLKPKTLGLILQEMQEKDASRYVKMLQEQK
jgi:flagellar motility protein MotE (MotC chaperone)